MKKLLYLLIIIVLSACGDTSTSNLPDGIEYSVINEEQNNNLKKTSINIRLNKKVDEATLKMIAEELKSKREEFEKLWISYYLPEMKVGSGAWATSHYTPTLTIQILGSTEKEDEVTAQTDDINGEVTGKWRSENSLMGAALIMYKEKDGKIYMQTTFKDGSQTTEELKETKLQGLKRFDYENSRGEYYLIEKNRNLGMYDSDGKYEEAVVID